MQEVAKAEQKVYILEVSTKKKVGWRVKLQNNSWGLEAEFTS